ncbi:MAG: hypothetical protein KY462_12075 [Actinobacteria bacterium]|nr:hypothetical protein [Actinomycetota bacterium]
MRAGDYNVGLRAGSATAETFLRRLLGAHLVDDDDAPANYSLHLDDAPTTRSGRALHLLFTGGSLTVRTASPQRAVHALIARLSDHVRGSDGAALRLKTGAVVGPAGAAIVPRRFARELVAHERRLADAGLRLVDTGVELDPDTGELVVPEPALTVEWSALELLPPGPDGASVPAGRYPVVVWTTEQERTRGQLLAQAAGLARDLDAVGPQRALDALTGILGTVPVAVLPASVPVAIRDLGAAVAD